MKIPFAVFIGLLQLVSSQPIENGSGIDDASGETEYIEPSLNAGDFVAQLNTTLERANPGIYKDDTSDDEYPDYGANLKPKYQYEDDDTDTILEYENIEYVSDPTAEDEYSYYADPMHDAYPVYDAEPDYDLVTDYGPVTTSDPYIKGNSTTKRWKCFPVV